jgi:hypothetical protein
MRPLLAEIFMLRMEFLARLTDETAHRQVCASAASAALGLYRECRTPWQSQSETRDILFSNRTFRKWQLGRNRE